MEPSFDCKFRTNLSQDSPNQITATNTSNHKNAFSMAFDPNRNLTTRSVYMWIFKILGNPTINGIRIGVLENEFPDSNTHHEFVGRSGDVNEPVGSAAYALCCSGTVYSGDCKSKKRQLSKSSAHKFVAYDTVTMLLDWTREEKRVTFFVNDRFDKPLTINNIFTAQRFRYRHTMIRMAVYLGADNTSVRVVDFTSASTLAALHERMLSGQKQTADAVAIENAHHSNEEGKEHEEEKQEDEDANQAGIKSLQNQLHRAERTLDQVLTQKEDMQKQLADNTRVIELKKSECAKQSTEIDRLKAALTLEQEEEKQQNTLRPLDALRDDLVEHVNVIEAKYADTKMLQMFDESPCTFIAQKQAEIRACFSHYGEVTQSILCLCNGFSDYLKHAEVFMAKLVAPKLEDYKSWNLDQMMDWIVSLDDGAYAEYADDLRNAFIESEIISGSILPELTRSDLSDSPFKIKSFLVKRDLVNHFRALLNFMH